MADILNPHVIYDRLSYPISYIIKSVISSKIESNLDRCSDQMLASICIHKRSGFVYSTYQVCVCISRPQNAKCIQSGMGLALLAYACIEMKENTFFACYNNIAYGKHSKTGIIFMSATNVSTLIEKRKHIAFPDSKQVHRTFTWESYSLFHICSY